LESEVVVGGAAMATNLVYPAEWVSWQRWQGVRCWPHNNAICAELLKPGSDVPRGLIFIEVDFSRHNGGVVRLFGQGWKTTIEQLVIGSLAIVSTEEAVAAIE
jgi:hypothetical protein